MQGDGHGKSYAKLAGGRAKYSQLQHFQLSASLLLLLSLLLRCLVSYFDKESRQHKNGVRLWLIELLSYWEGGINTSSLIDAFNISRQQAMKDIHNYNELSPGALKYNSSKKRFEPTGELTFLFISGDVSEYLNWITGITPAQNYSSVQHESISHPPRRISPEIVRPLVTAVRNQQRVDVDYASISSASNEGRIIAPHTFVNAGLRWHVRAWCEKSQGYRDFVLSRFRGTPELQEGVTEHTVERDEAWNTYVTLVIKPDPRLSREQQAVLERDYLMEKGELRITTRAALAQYTLQNLQVSTKVLDANPVAQQLVLANYEQIKQWLY
jgi:predicted DNA-binding transcriptional regulator YafY